MSGAVHEPSFSIVIPAYQAAPTIAESVESALGQTVPAAEVIVSDDGSTDALAEALQPYGADITLIRNEHRGVAAARNAGARAARGDFVLVLDADDVLLPRKLEALSQLATARPELDLLATDVFFEQGGRRVARFTDANPFALEDQRTAIFERCFVGWPAVRRERLLAAGGFDESLRTGSDWDCWLRLILDGARAGLHDEPLSVYRVHEASLTAPRARTLRDRVRLLEKGLEHPGLRADERPLLERALARARTRALAAEAEDAVRARRPDRRAAALRLVRQPGAPLALRAGAAAASLAPGLAGVWLRRRSRRSVLDRAVPGGAA